MRLVRQAVNWRYAAGEFVLVISGILVALAIDACADRARDANQGATYLKELTTELRRDSAYFARRQIQLDGIRTSVLTILRAFEEGDPQGPDLAGQLFQSLVGDVIPVEPVVWEELRTTGNLRLITDGSLRTQIVAHYLDRAARLRSVDENFTPAIRALRALAWDVLPVESFFRFFREGDTDLSNRAILDALQRGDEAEFVLKRTILTASAGQAMLGELAASSAVLARAIEDYGS